CTVGGVIGGYCETGSTKSATAPSRIVTNAMTFARTGRSMKNLANTTPCVALPTVGAGLAPAPSTATWAGGPKGRPYDRRAHGDDPAADEAGDGLASAGAVVGATCSPTRALGSPL